jgi:hypothetical protein
MGGVMTKFSNLVGAVAVGLVVTITPASADAPTVLTNQVTFVDENPCTGLDHTITIFMTAFVHDDHNNNFVVHVERTGTTDSGYTMFNGQSQFVDNSHVVVQTFKDLWRSDDGSMFEAAALLVINLNQGEIQVQQGAIRCIHT